MKKSKNILLIGSNSGIGLQLKKDLYLGNNLFCTSSKKLKDTNYLNFNSKNSIIKTIYKAYKELKNFEIIIFNSFLTKKRKRFSKSSLNEIESNIKRNIFCYLLIMRLILKFQKKKTKIIFISTEAIKNSSWGLLPYSLSKSAIECMLKTISNENKHLKTIIIRLKKFNTPGYLRVNGNVKKTKDVKLASKIIRKEI